MYSNQYNLVISFFCHFNRFIYNFFDFHTACGHYEGITVFRAVNFQFVAIYIRDLDAIKYSTNPYNVNSMTAAVGIGTLADPDYTKKNCKTIMETREYVLSELRAMGFSATPSVANFVFATHPRLSGADYYTALRERGILVRHFTGERIAEYNRITIGSRAEMDKLLLATKAILEEKI